MECKNDNPFGPICDCNVRKSPQIADPLCFFNQKTLDPLKRIPPSCLHPRDFQRHFKQPGFPCLHCRKTGCTHFYESGSCADCMSHGRGV